MRTRAPNGLVRCPHDGASAAHFELVSTAAPGSGSGDGEAAPTLALECNGSPTDATAARTSTVSFPLCIEDVNDCEPVVNGVALPNALTLTALTGAGGILMREQLRRRVSC